MKQLEQALEDNKVVDATIQQNKRSAYRCGDSGYDRCRTEEGLCDRRKRGRLNC